MNREQRIADLVLHGWEPKRTTELRGIFNHDINRGFGVVVDIVYTRTGDVSTKSVLGEVKLLQGHRIRDCDWNDITDATLDRIEERLRAV